MPDEQGSSTRSEEDSRSGLWAGIRTLLFGGNSEPSLREQIEEVIDEAEEEGAERRGSSIVGDLSPIERKMLRNLLHFGEQTVDDVAVPRGEIIAISESASFEEIVAIFADAGHSRLPVYRETLDEVIGMMHIKDVFPIIATSAEPPADWTTLMRQPLFVPQARNALDVLADMRQQRIHLAVVVDEYSGTDGLITIEDLVEEIVGDIEDEHDEEAEEWIVALPDGMWDCDARAELEVVVRAGRP